MTYSSGKKVEYTYDGAGTKLTMKTLQGSTVETLTTYVGGFVYEGATPALSFFASPEGRVVKSGSGFEYQYSISDHQGNTRILFTSVTPSASTLTATFEGDSGDNSGLFANVNATHVVPFTAANHTSGGSKVVRMNQNYASGPSKTIKVYPGDAIDAEVWTYYEANSGYGTGSPGVAAMVTAIATGFGGVSGGGGESGSIYDGVNSALGGFGLGGNAGDEAPAAYLNYILFDQQYKVLDMGWKRVPPNNTFTKEKITLDQVSVKEAGYIFVYLSYEDQSNNYVYFDDFKITHTKSNLIQGNEYYPFGLQTANSWTREAVTGNNYLANGGTELNQTSQLYDLVFRNYDPALGRMFQVDPMASKYGSITPYNYSLNNPSNMNDPLGDDVEPQPPYPREYVCTMCWRDGNDLNYMRVAGGGSSSLGYDWRPGTSGFAPGSGNNWADGMQYSDWSSMGGSDLFRDGLAMGLTGLGGKLYDTNGGRRDEIKEHNGRLGHWERRSRFSIEGWDGKPGLMPATEIWDVFVPAEKKLERHQPRNQVVDAIHRGQETFADNPWGGLFLTFVTGGPGIFELAGLAKGAALGLGKLAAGSSSRILVNSARQLQSKFKHAGAFGILGSYSKANAVKFSAAINKHVNSASTKAIQGTFRGDPVIHYLDASTGLNVISSPSGQFISGWKLSPEQLFNVLKHGGL